jgi:hypothetical protein
LDKIHGYRAELSLPVFTEEALTGLEKEVLTTTPGPRVAALTHSG